MGQNDTLAQPEGLSEMGKLAYSTIMTVLRRHGATETGGCRAFYSPTEWADRREAFAQGSVLVVVYDGGGDLKNFFSMDACFFLKNDYALYEEMMSALGDVGLFFEEGTCWYSGVYPSK